ncbi:hypothetical protein Tco_0815610 [Tanacetum coccineum]
MINAEVDDSNKGGEKVTDAAKADDEKTSEVKDDPKKTKLPPTSSIYLYLQVLVINSLNFFYDSSLVSTVKDTIDTEINSLLEVKIQFEVPHTQSPSMLSVPLQQQTKTPIPIPTITTDAPIITTAGSESDALSVVRLRVAKLEKDISDLKKIDLFAEALATLKTQVPSIVDNYLGSKVGDTPIVDLEQGFEKSALDILKIKREQAEKQQTPKFTIKSTDNAALQEYDQKTLIEDENTMDKGVADTVQNHKRKHDVDEHDDDEDPLAGPNQGKAPSKGSKTSKSAPAKEPVEEPITEVVMDDAGNDVVHDEDQPQDASEPKTTKTPNPYWFKQPPRPPTPDPKWNKRQVVLDQLEQPWFNQMVSAIKDPLTFDDLMATPIDFSKYVLNILKINNLTQDILLGPAYNLLKGTCSSSIELEYHFQECFNALTDRLDWNNPEGDRYPFDLSKPLHMQGHLGHLTVAADYFFNNELEYLKSSDLENYGEGHKLWHKSHLNKFSKHNVYSTKKILGVKSVSVKKLHRYGHLEEIVVKRADHQFYKFKEGDLVDLHLNDIEDMLLLAVQHKLLHLTDNDIVDFMWLFIFLELEFKELHTPSHNPPGVIYEDLTKQKRVMRANELYKFSDGTLKKVRDELHHRIHNF